MRIVRPVCLPILALIPCSYSAAQEQAPSSRPASAPASAHAPRRLIGRCVLESGAPVSDLRVRCAQIEEGAGVLAARKRLLHETTTGADGAFDVPLDGAFGGRVELRIVRPGGARIDGRWNMQTIGRRLDATYAFDVGELESPPGGAVQGRVLARDGAPARWAATVIADFTPGATSAELDDRPAALSKAAADVDPATGNYQLAGLREGPWRLHVLGRTQSESARMSIIVRRGEVVTADIPTACDPREFSGTLLVRTPVRPPNYDSEHGPLVTLVDSRGGVHEPGTAYLEDVHDAFINIPPGPCSVRVRGVGVVPGEVAVPSADDRIVDVYIRPENARTIEFQAVDEENGRPVSGVSIRLTSDVLRDWKSPTLAANVAYPNIPPVAFGVSAKAPGFRECEAEVAAGESGSSSTICIKMKRVPVVRGTVVQRDGSPPSVPLTASLEWRDTPFFETTRVFPDGQFELPRRLDLGYDVVVRSSSPALRVEQQRPDRLKNDSKVSLTLPADLRPSHGVLRGLEPSDRGRVSLYCADSSRRRIPFELDADGRFFVLRNSAMSDWFIICADVGKYCAVDPSTSAERAVTCVLGHMSGDNGDEVEWNARKKLGWIDATVTDHGKPLPFFIVELASDKSRGRWLADAAGHVRIGPLPGYEYQCEVESSDGLWRRRAPAVQVSPGKAMQWTMDVPLTRGKIQMRRTDGFPAGGGRVHVSEQTEAGSVLAPYFDRAIGKDSELDCALPAGRYQFAYSSGVDAPLFFSDVIEWPPKNPGAVVVTVPDSYFRR